VPPWTPSPLQLGTALQCLAQTRRLLVVGLERVRVTEAINPGAGGSACQAGVRGQRLPPCRALRRATQQASAAVQTHTAAVRSDTMSIYAERDSVDGADSAVNTVGTVGDPHLLDQELVVPDYDDEAETAEPPAAPTDPAACIADFKAKREKHERWALAVILNAFLIANMGSMLLTTLAVRNPDADTNPFKEVVNGTLQWTEDGLQWYTHMFGLKNWAQASFFSTPLPLDEIAASFQWSGIAARQIPGPQSIGVWMFVALGELPNLATIGGSYGWPSVALVVAMWVRFLVFGRLNFAKEPIKGRNILLRKPTAYEHEIMMMMCWVNIYPIFDLFCIKGGQWDGKTVGRAGAILMVFLECAWLVLWWFKWGRDGLFMPRGLDEKGKADRFATAWLWALLFVNVHQFLHYIFLLPDLPDNTELVTLTGEVRTGEMWFGYVTSQAPAVLTFICFRKQIFSALKAPLRRKQRLQDGAFIAALLADEDDVGDLVSEAAELFRGVPFSKVTADLLRSSKGTSADYALSQPCKLNSVDFFVSHSAWTMPTSVTGFD
jgi:hypothetical protein